MNSLIRSIRRNWRTAYIFITVFIDVVAIVSSAAFAALLLHLIPAYPLVSWAFFVFFTCFTTIVLLFVGPFLGLYRASFHSNLNQQFRIAGKAYFYSFLFTLASFTVFKVTDYQRGFVFPFFFLLPFFFLANRFLLYKFNTWMQSKGFGIHNTLIVGYENGGMKVFEHVSGFPELGYVVKGIVGRSRTRKSVAAKSGMDLDSIYNFKELDDVVSDERIDRIFVPSLKYLTDGYGELLNLCRSRRIKLKVLSPESEDLLRFSKVYDIAGIPLFSPPRVRVEKAKRLVKRAFDLFVASIIVMILSPILLLISLAIYLEDGSPILFFQRRALIKGGREIKFLKFRSMAKDAESKQAEMYKYNQTSGGLFLVEKDPRVTHVGTFLRRYSMDELPQLFNVIKGEMSLVGPRPLSIADLENISEDNKLGGYYKLRGKAKPGMTGLWQISGRREVSFKEMVLLDLYYIENQSMLFDLEILFATIPVVLFGRGAY